MLSSKWPLGGELKASCSEWVAMSLSFGGLASPLNSVPAYRMPNLLEGEIGQAGFPHFINPDFWKCPSSLSPGHSRTPAALPSDLQG